MHCRRFGSTPCSRRELLQSAATGFGAVAFAALAGAWNRLAAGDGPWTPRSPHHPPRATSVIFLYMDGGPSQVDTFDYKPQLARYHGKPARETIGPLAPTQFDSIGSVMQSPWKFRQCGEAGHWVSDLFPHLSQQLDEVAFIKSMTSNFSEHTFANFFLHTGSGLQGRPSMGAWFGYGLGTDNEDLPGFVVLNGGLIPPGGLDNFGSGFLPASFQASVLLPTDQPLANILRRESSVATQRQKLDLLAQLDASFLEATARDSEVEAAIANYETAFRMQTSVPGLVDIHDESATTLRAYGMEAEYPQTRIFGRQCLIARRLVERGVRFVELTCPDGNGDRWDQHQNLRDGHEKNCRTVDQPIAALLADLKQRGLLESTLVVWTGEFGRTPFAQGTDGRDHNPFGFTLWLAGGGIRAGATVGETDEWGYRAVTDRYEIHDLHATMLHLLGIEHTRSTFRFGGRDMRLTDVHGRLIQGILA